MKTNLLLLSFVLLNSIGHSQNPSELIGHDSEAVSRAYTHLDADTLRAAVDRLPDLIPPAGGARAAKEGDA